MKTLVVNLFAGPSAGKTSLASRLFSELNITKPFGEPFYVQEYAKELVLQKRFDLLANQPHVTTEQCRRIEILIGNVDIVVTDSPVLLGLAYSSEEHFHETKEIIDSLYAREDVENINFFVERIGREFDPRGRMGNVDDAIQKDQEIKDILMQTNTPFHTVQNKYDMVSVIAKISDKIVDKKRNFFPESAPNAGYFNHSHGMKH
ncbi:MAG: AAA family ATPase [Paludibacter sp.]|nr:AAA family ATPase [Paludibacter sp.]